MIRKIVLGGIVLTVGLFGSAGQNDALACNRTAGCAMDSILEDHDMMRDGRMGEAMQAGRANVEAFRLFLEKQKAFQEQQKAYASRN